MRVAQLIESGDTARADLLMKLFAAHLSKLFSGVELKTDSGSYRKFVDINVQPPGGKKGMHYQGSGSVTISSTDTDKIVIRSVGGFNGWKLVRAKTFDLSRPQEALGYAKAQCHQATEYANKYPVNA